MKKIMFNDLYGLTEAVLSGRKTQTRRIYKTPANAYGGLEVENGNIISFDANGNEITTYPKYKVGEVVAIAQSYKNAGFDPNTPRKWTDKGTFIFSDCPISQLAGWDNKLFVYAVLMPNHIRITDVRVERLNDISDADCIAEGVTEENVYGNPEPQMCETEYRVYYTDNKGRKCALVGNTPREAYAVLIDCISGKGTWDSNPYVFVYDFELVN